MMAEGLRIGIVQFAATPDKDKNLESILKYIGRHSDADLVVFPEYSMAVGERGVTRSLVDSAKEPIDGLFLTRVSRRTRDLGVHVLINVIEDAGGLVYNTTVLSSDTGDVVPLHRKAILFDAYGYKESSLFKPGELRFTIIRVRGVGLGVATCFEARFPEIFRAMAVRGAVGFIVQAGWYKGLGKEDQWVVTLRCRAHENTCYMVGVGNAAEQFIGRSIVVNPHGLVEVDLGYGEKSVGWVLRREVVDEVREKLPLISIAGRRGLLQEPGIDVRVLEL